MSILLINPTHVIREKNIWKKINRCLPPLGLGYLAAYLKERDIDVRIIDLQVYDGDFDGLIREIREGDFEYIGITATTVQINAAIYLAERIKERNRNKKIVLGGAHPTAVPEEVLKNSSVDFIVMGEGEKTFYELLSGADPESVNGLSYRRNGNIVFTPERTLIENLDNLPFPAYHLFEMNRYRPSTGNYLRLPAMSMVTSRGCPGRCTFCDTRIFGRKVRTRSAKNILDEILFLKDKYGIKEISFYDDTITVPRRRILELCRLIQDRKIDITWSCMSRIDCVDGDLLFQMKKAGCHQIGYGIESGDEKILLNINKRISLPKVRDVVMATRKAGIDARGMFMLGNIGETDVSMKKTIDFAISLNLDIFVFNITTPYPGSQLFQHAKENGLLTTYDWDRYDLGEPLMDLPTVDRDTIKIYYRQAYKRCYLRILYLLGRLKKIRSFAVLKMNLQIFGSFVKDFLFTHRD